MRPHDNVFARLAQPFESGEVKVRSQGGKQLHYITARTAMNRLDDVLGPANWWDEYLPAENSVLCRLTIRLPDGSTLTKSDAGGYAGMSDSGDDDKSGYSDAFKRACVKFGVARYLYRDGVPHFVQDWAGEVGESPAPAPAGDFPCQVEAPPETWSKWIGQRLRRANADWLREMVYEGVEPDVRQQHRELANEPRVVNHVVTRLIELNKVPFQAVSKPDKPQTRDINRARDVLRGLFERSPKAIKRGVEKYLVKRLDEARATLGLPDPDVHDAADADAAHREAFENASCN